MTGALFEYLQEYQRWLQQGQPGPDSTGGLDGFDVDNPLIRQHFQNQADLVPDHDPAGLDASSMEANVFARLNPPAPQGDPGQPVDSVNGDGRLVNSGPNDDPGQMIDSDGGPGQVIHPTGHGGDGQVLDPGAYEDPGQVIYSGPSGIDSGPFGGDLQVPDAGPPSDPGHVTDSGTLNSDGRLIDSGDDPGQVIDSGTINGDGQVIDSGAYNDPGQVIDSTAYGDPGHAPDVDVDYGGYAGPGPDEGIEVH